MGWFGHWQFDVAEIDPVATEDFINLLLAFPPGEFFNDRIFEVWCLQQTIDAFRRCGAVLVAGPQPLSERKSGPICELQYDKHRFNIWFQLPLPTSVASWRYLHSGQVLRGIPDITVLSDTGQRLLIDAKRRLVFAATRSEETYKMLGYLENFRALYDNAPYYGVLCFLSSGDLFTEVSTGRGDRLFLVGAHPEDSSVCALGRRMDAVVMRWLSLVTS